MTEHLHHATITTPGGPLTIFVDGDGRVVASGWNEGAGPVLERAVREVRDAPSTERRDLGEVSAAVRDWLAGDLVALDRVEVRQASGAFIERAWRELRAVPPGTTATYIQLATAAGRPLAARAAAQACARNAVALFVPCHRVVRSDGGLGGFRWGLDTKRWLLAHEGASVA